MKTVSILTRSLSQTSVAEAFNDLHPDIVHVKSVCMNQYRHLIARGPVEAGNTFHRLLCRMADHEPLSPGEKAYLPWLNALREMVRSLGGRKMEAEYGLRAVGDVPHGTCDLRVHGGPRKIGVIEVKVLTKGSFECPRGRDYAQVASYAWLLAGAGSFDRIWAAVAYVELGCSQVRLVGFKNSRQLISKTLALLRAA